MERLLSLSQRVAARCDRFRTLRFTEQLHCSCVTCDDVKSGNLTSSQFVRSPFAGLPERNFRINSSHASRQRVKWKLLTVLSSFFLMQTMM